jgi:hypothetical protein
LRLLTSGAIGWALLLGLQQLSTSTLHAIATPAVFTLLAWRYFRARGAREALPTALLWTAIVALLDLRVVAGTLNRSLELFQSIVATWLPYSPAVPARVRRHEGATARTSSAHRVTSLSTDTTGGQEYGLELYWWKALQKGAR